MKETGRTTGNGNEILAERKAAAGGANERRLFDTEFCVKGFQRRQSCAHMRRRQSGRKLDRNQLNASWAKRAADGVDAKPQIGVAPQHHHARQRSMRGHAAAPSGAVACASQ
jgi:hypothetical protein